MDINNLNSNPLVDRRGRDLVGEETRADARKQADSGGAAAGATAGTADEQKAAEARAASSREKSTEDQVQLSAEARSLKQIESRVSESEAFDSERVAQIRDAIVEGRYHVDAQRLADNFLELESILDQ